MKHNHFYKIWRYIRHIHPWYFLVITIVFSTISLFALRNNNIQMIKYRDAVYAADKVGDQAKLEKALYDLRVHVYSHMNTSLTSGSNSVYPPIQLKYTFEREQAKQQAALGQNNAGLYHEAQQRCAAEHPNASGAEAISCIEASVAAQGIRLGNIPDALYKFDFVSAKWSPDLAGWSIVITVVGLVLFLVTAAYKWWMKRN